MCINCITLAIEQTITTDNNIPTSTPSTVIVIIDTERLVTGVGTTQ